MYIEETFEYDIPYYQRLLETAANVLTCGLELLPNQYMLGLF